ncbi:MAG: class I SAM-dependent methyltransferase [Myxococcales bacterium]|nr:class I SAM-dependent methyltransferase [Myxococcales bacterium]
MADPSTREPHKNPIKRLMETTWQVTRPLAETLAETPEGARICDVGAGGRRVRPDAVCVDITAGPNVDVVADSHDLPLESGTFDLVICTGTLNLCRDPAKVLSELQRILRPGGASTSRSGCSSPTTPSPRTTGASPCRACACCTSGRGSRRCARGPTSGPCRPWRRREPTWPGASSRGPAWR